MLTLSAALVAAAAKFYAAAKTAATVVTTTTVLVGGAAWAGDQLGNAVNDWRIENTHSNSTVVSAVAITPITRAQARVIERQWQNDGHTVIFRSGSGNATNFTPRAGESALSYYLAMPSGNFTMTTIEIVNATGVLRAERDGVNHVSVFPTNPASLPEWQASRPTALEAPHPFVLILQSISFKVK